MTAQPYLRNAEHEINKLHDTLELADKLQVALHHVTTPEDRDDHYRDIDAIVRRLRRRIIALGGHVQP